MSEKDHPTQYYPNWDLKFYLKKHIIGNVPDEDCQDICNKAFESANTFSYGVLSVGNFYILQN